MALVQKAFSDIITFSRSSNATRVGPTGLVEYAPHNLLTYSQELGTSSGGSTVTANVLAAPDGTVTADKITGSTNYWAKAVSISSGTITFSIFLKSSGDDSIDLYVYDGAYTAANVNLASGTIVGGTIQNVGNGWYRCSITKAISATVSEVGLTGISAPGVYAWGAQLAVGPYPLDYTPTTSAAVYGPRFDYDPVTLAAKGLLVEEQRTNLQTNSENFSSAIWTVDTGSSASNTTVAPDGIAICWKYTPNTSSTTNHRVMSAVTTSQQTATHSIFIKADGYTRVALRESATTGAAIGFDISNQTIITTYSAGGCTASNGTIQSLGNGWYRLSATFSFASATNQRLGLYVVAPGWTSGDPESVAWAGNGTSGVLVWGAQFEAGSFATSYIPTLASTVTRSADVASVNTLSPWFNATELSLYCEFDILSTASGSVAAVSLDSGSANGYMFYKSGSVTDYYAFAGSNLVKIGDLSSNTTTKTALAYNASGGYGSMNGAATANIAAGSVTTPTQFLLGKSWAGNQLSGHLRRVSFYPRKLSSAELQALTA